METMNLTEAAQYLGISYSTARLWLRRGILTNVGGGKDMREVRVSKERLDGIKANGPAQYLPTRSAV